ncbi:NAD(P)H-binding protein [Galbibacter sp. PAP.153]|uniref:SDR family oxidoreductase n=1 Tax=Galbibacter sp. PAP.153 TaxID=3104623 RepID=UPI0030093C18
MRTKPKILLTGGTGQLGRMLLKQIDYEDFHIDILTRNKIIDTIKNVGHLNADLTKVETLSPLRLGYDIIIHCASDPKNSESIDIQGTQNLLKSIKGDRTKNFIYISIVGVDKSTFPYYRNKLKTEKLIVNSGIPYTILRITQFHDFIYDRILSTTRSEDELTTAPDGLKFQSIDLIDVCGEILGLLKIKATNSTIQIGGPEILKISDITKNYQEVIRPEKKISLIPPHNDFQKLFTTGINLCPNHKTGKITWRDFLIKK